MANVQKMTMKKIVVGNPLINFRMEKEYEEYEAIQSDDELVSFFHKMLDKCQGRPLLERFIYAMISFSVGKETQSINILL